MYISNFYFKKWKILNDLMLVKNILEKMYIFNIKIHIHIHITANILYALSNTLHLNYTFETGIGSFNFLQRFTL